MKKDNSSSNAFEKKLDDFLHTVGDNLHSLRMIRKATLKTVAKEIKIPPGRLSKIEKGFCPHCKFGTLVMLCKYYKIKLTDVATKGKFKVRNGATISKKGELHKNEKTKKRKNEKTKKRKNEKTKKRNKDNGCLPRTKRVGINTKPAYRADIYSASFWCLAHAGPLKEGFLFSLFLF